MSIEEELRGAARQWIEAGGTQPELSKAAGCSQSTIAVWLKGGGTRLAIAERIASAIGRPLRLGGRRKKTKADDVSDAKGNE